MGDESPRDEGLPVDSKEADFRIKKPWNSQEYCVNT